MNQSDVIVMNLEEISDKLTELGHADLASEVDSVVAILRQDAEGNPAAEMMTVEEAATQLGVRSIFTVTQWAVEGILDGFCRGNQVVVTRASVERILHTPRLAQLRAVDADLDPFDAGDEVDPRTSWSGRKPWEASAPPSPDQLPVVEEKAANPFDVLADDAIEEYRRGETMNVRKIAEELGISFDRE